MTRHLRTALLGLSLVVTAAAVGCSPAPGEASSEGTTSSGGAAGSSSSGSTGTPASSSSGSSSSGGGSGGGGGSSTTTSTGGGSSTSTGSGALDAGAGDGLDPSVAPGGNFDLSLWELQEPIGSPGAPTTILPAALEGPKGFHDSYFYTDPTDGAMTFWDPEDGVMTANSSYPRSELREMTASGAAANWPVAGTNTLSVSVAVTQVPDHVCVGQIHLGTAIQSGLAASTKPLLELYYYATGKLELGIEDGPTGNQTVHDITTIPLGTKFSYTIVLAGDGTITLVVDGATSTFTMPASFNGYGMYFKAGDYDQTAGTSGSVGATVKIYALAVSHAP